jgi:putative long chain acyl-CoA synthase
MLRVGLGELEASDRPDIIWVTDSIPVSESFRPIATGLVARGVPKPGSKVWYRDSEGRYRRYTSTVAKSIDWSWPTAHDETVDGLVDAAE